MKNKINNNWIVYFLPFLVALLLAGMAVLGKQEVSHPKSLGQAIEESLRHTG